MADVQELTINGLDPADATALVLVQSEIAQFMAQGEMARAVGELISYTLSNQGLIEKGKRTRTYRPLMSFVIEGLKAVARFLGINTNPGNTLFSNIRFNARLLATPAPQAEATEAALDGQVEIVMAQSFPRDDDHLARLEQVYFQQLRRMVGTHARGTPESILRRDRVAEALRTSRKSAEHAAANGFELNARQAKAYAGIHAAISAGLKADHSVQRQLYEAFDHAMKTLTPADLNAAGVAGAPRAAAMHEFLTGADGLRKTVEGRTDMLASFMALSQTHPELRSALGQIKPPKVADLKWSSIDDWVRSILTTVTNLITRMSLNPRKPADTLSRELDLLSLALGEIQQERRILAGLEMLNEKVDEFNAFLSGKLAQGSETATETLKRAADRVPYQPVKSVLMGTSMLTSLGSSRTANATGDALTKMMNHAEGYEGFRSLLSNMRGMTESNAPLLRLINPVTARIDQVRQVFREGVPAELARSFSRPLKKEEWTRLHKIGRADLMALGLEDARSGLILSFILRPRSECERIGRILDGCNRVSPNL